MKNIPNLFSVARIILALGLFLFEPFTLVFMIIHIAACLTDAVDGFLARVLMAQTKFGANLDSIADHILVASIFINLAPVLSVKPWIIGLVVSVFIFKAFIILYAVRKYGKSVFSHSYGHKLGATLCFLFPLFVLWLDANVVISVLVAYMWLVMTEEVFIIKKSPEPNPNFKGFLFESINASEEVSNTSVVMTWIKKLLIKRAVANKHMPFAKLVVWEPWEGCTPVSEACKNCYYNYAQDTRIIKTKEFDKNNFKQTKIVITGFMSDIFHPNADDWRVDFWRKIKENPKTTFLLLTKRIERFRVGLPEDWESGYPNVILGVTVENQQQADLRLPVLCDLPIKLKYISCSPLLEEINIKSYLKDIQYVSVAGEVAKQGRLLELEWVIALNKQCKEAGVSMFFKDTGSLIKVNGKVKKVYPLFQRRLAKKLSVSNQM